MNNCQWKFTCCTYTCRRGPKQVREVCHEKGISKFQHTLPTDCFCWKCCPQLAVPVQLAVCSTKSVVFLLVKSEWHLNRCKTSAWIWTPGDQYSWDHWAWVCSKIAKIAVWLATPEKLDGVCLCPWLEAPTSEWMQILYAFNNATDAQRTYREALPTKGWTWSYPLVMTNIAIENGHL